MNSNAVYPNSNPQKKFVTTAWLDKFAKTGSGWLIIISGSMAPLIQIKDQIFIKRTAPSHLHIGDIITFWQENILVTHRVIRRHTKSGNVYFVEKGDANANYSWVEAKSIIGKVRKIKKGDREIILDTMVWNAVNRAIGLSLFGAYVLRAINRKAPFIPEWFKNIVRQLFGISEWVKEKILKAILNS